MPLLEIFKGGNAQIDLFNRMLVNNNCRMRKFMEMSIFNEEKQYLENIDCTDAIEIEDKFNQKVPSINSFFPFSYNEDNDIDNTNLNEILLFSSVSDESALDIDLGDP